MNGNRTQGTLEYKPGLNFFSSSNNKLKKSDEYVINLIFDDENHRKILKRPSNFPDFKNKRL